MSRRGALLSTPARVSAGTGGNPGSLATELGDPCFLLVDFDFEDDAMVFSRTRPEWLATRLRLSARDLPLESLEWLPARTVFEALPRRPSAPATHYLFHLPFCGSSFLTRYLERAPVLLLRDPAALDALFRKQEQERYPANISGLRRATLALFNRQRPGHATVVRTAGYYPEMLPHLVRASTFRAGLFLYSEPGHFLAQVLKSAERRRQLRLLLASKRPFVRRVTGEELGTLTDAAVAALFWLLSVETLLTLARGSAGGRLRTLDCEALFAGAGRLLPRVGALYGLDGLRVRAEEERAVQSTHAKTGEAFTPAQRQVMLQQVREALDEELRAGLEVLRPERVQALLAELKTLSI